MKLTSILKAIIKWTFRLLLVGLLVAVIALFVAFGINFNKKDLGILRDLSESGKVVPAVTKTFALTETAAAYKYLETGHARGKIAITIE